MDCEKCGAQMIEVTTDAETGFGFFCPGCGSECYVELDVTSDKPVGNAAWHIENPDPAPIKAKVWIMPNTHRWLPISDAPRDGTKILILQRFGEGEYEPAVGYWCEDLKFFTFDGGDHVGGDDGDLFQFIDPAP